MPTLTIEELLGCCASREWAAVVESQQPFEDLDSLLSHSQAAWWQQTPVTGWLAAFKAHPVLGAKIPQGDATDQSQNRDFLNHSTSEQAAAQHGSNACKQELVALNQEYADKFGHVFLLCAQGRNAEDILGVLKLRLANTPLAELLEAAAQQMLITEQRLTKLWEGKTAAQNSPAQHKAAPHSLLMHYMLPADKPAGMSPITCHVLDTALGAPAAGLPVTLCRQAPQSKLHDSIWYTLARGTTNKDGRTPGLLPAQSLPTGTYRVRFDVDGYAGATNQATFYESPCIDFVVQPGSEDQHFHIPLLLSPFAYSTYRGS